MSTISLLPNTLAVAFQQAGPPYMLAGEDSMFSYSISNVLHWLSVVVPRMPAV